MDRPLQALSEPQEVKLMLTPDIQIVLSSLELKFNSMRMLMIDAAVSLLPWALMFFTSIDVAYAHWPKDEPVHFDMPQCHDYEYAD